MWKRLRAVLVGMAVWTLLLYGFALYMWTAIHSGWGDRGRYAFLAAMLIVPIAGAFLAAWWSYRRL